MRQICRLLGLFALMLCYARPAGAELAMHLRLDEARGNTASDAAGRGNNGTIHAAAWADGKSGRALTFGKGAYVEVPASPSLALAKSFTLDLWVFPTAVDDGLNHRVLTMFPFPGPPKHRTGWCLYVNGREMPKSLLFMTYYASGSGIRVAHVGLHRKLSANRWYHVVVAYDGRCLQMIVDGTLVQAKEMAGLIEASGPLRVSDEGPWFGGRIDEVRVFTEGRTIMSTPEVVPADNTPMALADYAAGRAGDSLRIEPGGYVDVPVPERLRVTRQLTIDTWICPSVVDDGRNHIILAMQRWVSPGAYCFYINDMQLDKTLVFMAYNRQGVAKSVAARGRLDAGRWYHTVVVCDGKEMRLYVDGELQGRVVHTGEFGADGPIRLSDRNAAGPCFSGRVDELRVYDRALPVDGKGNVPADADPVLYWPFDRRRDNVVADASGNGHHGQLHTPQRPHEMIRAGRKEGRPALADFEDLRDWEVAQHYGAQCTLKRSQTRQMWGRYVGEVTYSGASRASYAEIRPKGPIAIQGAFDCVDLWVYGDWWGYAASRRTMEQIGITPASLAVRITDAEGETHELPLGRIDAKDWFMFHGKFAPMRWKGEWGGATYRSWGGDGDNVIDYPAQFVSLVLRPCADKAPRTIYLDSLAFYKGELKPVSPRPLPRPLPFPTTPDTILPSCKPGHTNSASRRGKAYVFEYRGDDCKLQYIYTPRDGSLSDVAVVYNDSFRFVPCEAGGLDVDVDGDFVPASAARNNATLLAQSLRGNSLTTRWQSTVGSEQVAFDLALTIKGKSLIIDYQAQGGKVARATFGHTRGTPAPKLIDVPYLVVDGFERNKKGPFVVFTNGVFVLGLVDYYSSHGSRLFAERVPVKADSAAFNGGVLYDRKTDGRRNDVRERLFLTVSPDFHEVLPNIPNPASPLQARASKYIYAMVGGHRPQYVKLLKNYGLDYLMCQHHEPIWHPPDTAFSITYKPVPKLGSQGLKRYSRLIHDQGYLFGLYTCFSNGLSPSNEVWDEDAVSLWPDGKWKRGWFACYQNKPALALEWEERAAQRLHRDFGTDTVYCDVHTCGPPWSHTDYDARVPGAGKFRAVFESYGALMLNEQRVHGPTFSEGHYHWLYAGLTTGNYASMCSTDAPYKLPLLPDFDLLKIHPLQTDLAMGHSAFIFFGRYGDEWRKCGHPRNRYFNQHLAATIAYGHLGTLFDEAAWGFPGMLKQYYMLQQLQQRYATDEVETIRYHDGQQFVHTSAALANDSHKRGRFYVKYNKGLEIWVNYNAERDWQVSVKDTQYVLPPYGFVARKPDDILEFSALVDGKRAEYVDSPAYLYADSWNEEVALPKLRIKGAAVVRKGSQAEWWVIPIGDLKQAAGSVKPGPSRGCPMVSIRLDVLGTNVKAAEVWACAEDGGQQSRPACETADGWLTIRPSTQVPKYKVTPAP